MSAASYFTGAICSHLRASVPEIYGLRYPSARYNTYNYTKFHKKIQLWHTALPLRITYYELIRSHLDLFH